MTAMDRKRANSALLLEDFRLQRKVFRSLPEVVSLHTVERCNLRCIMCPRSVQQIGGKLERELLRQACEELFPTAIKAIVTGNQGEPLLGDFDVVLDAALRHSVKLDIVTNGTLLTASRYEALRPAIGHLNISVDSHRKETYEHIRRGGSFESLHANLEALAAARRQDPDPPVLSYSAVVMRSNVDHLSGFVEFAAGLGCDAVVLQPLRHWAHAVPEEEPSSRAPAESHTGAGSGCPKPGGGVPLPTEVLEQFELARQVARRLGINLYFADFGLPSVESRQLAHRVNYLADSSSMCWYLLRNLSIYHTGDVYPCCHPTNYLLGNMQESTLQSLWNGPLQQRLRGAHFSGRGTLFCRSCLHAPYLKERATDRLLSGLKGHLIRRNHIRNAASQERRVKS